MSVNRTLVSIYVVFLLALLLQMGREAGALNPDRQLDQYRADVWVFKDGLPRAHVLTMTQTPDGYLWLGTRLGLVRFDGANFERAAFVRQDPNSPASDSQSSIYSLGVSPSGELWVGTSGNGFGTLSPGFYKRFTTGPDDQQWSRTFVCYWTRNGLLLGGGHHATRVGVLYFVRQGRMVKELVWPKGVVRGIVEDRAGDLWCAVARVGLVQISQDGQIKQTLRRKDGLPGLDFNSICLDTGGALWLGTGKHGLCRYANGVFTAFTTRQGLPSEEITCLCPAREGCLWVGTPRGLARWYQGNWQVFRSVGGQVDGAVDALCEDHEGSLWVSTKGGLIRYCDTKLVPVHTGASASATPVCITIGPDGRCWAGTQAEGIVTPDENGIVSTALSTVQGLPANNIESLCTTRDGTLWISVNGQIVRYAHGVLTKYPLNSTWHFLRPDANGDLVALDRTRTLYRFHQGKEVSRYPLTGLGFPFCCQVDRSGRVWIGADTGLFCLHDGSFGLAEGWPRGRSALCLALDPDGQTVWAGTDGGLARYDGHRFRMYSGEHALPGIGTHLIALDRYGTLWLSIDGAIVSARIQDLDAFDAGTAHSIPFQQYNQTDGYSEADVNDEAIQTPDGRIIFANHLGFTFIDPAHLLRNPYSPPVTIEGAIANGKRIPFDKTARVAPGAGALEIHFAAMSFVAPEKVRCRYRLEGHDPTWNDVGTRRAAYYTDLPPGTYTFRVIACNNDGVWNKQGQALSITLLPHFWQTLWFRLLCGAQALLMVAAAYRQRVRQMMLRTQQLEAQNREVNALNSELHRLNELKDEFLANTSHELRTPLNGMIGIAESMLDGATGPLSTEQQYNMTLLTHSGKRLANLVNDILDFSRLRHRELSLHLRPVSLREMVEMILQLDRVIVGSKELRLINDVPATLPFVQADEDRLQQILHNLIGNAIKFTPAGTVRVSAEALQTEATEGSTGASVPCVAVSIADTGIGIPEDKLDRVFESFEQVEGSASRQYGGTGLGLAITKSLLELHGGQIRVKSKVGEGSVFTFTLPVSPQSIQEEPSPALSSPEFVRVPLPEPAPDPTADLPETTEERSTGGLVPRILIVDDEPVNLQVIKNFLRLEHYHLTLASNGQEALALLDQGLDPDIILLDVMMPRMTGYEVIRVIRQTALADRLPIILLSARNQPEDIVMGLEVGANDYLTKPIGKEELVARIHTHLQIRQAIEARLKMESELMVAAQIQRSMVPQIKVCDGQDGRFALAGLFQPARKVGGDLYDFFPLGDDRLYVAIGDVADKGVPAALLMARTVTLIRMLARQTSTAVAILSAVNHELYVNNDECLFVTLFCGILNVKTGHFDYASAGHDAPLLARAQGIQFLDLETGPALGLDDQAVFPAHECRLQPDDLLVLYTDGITEAMNPQGDLFSAERLTEALTGGLPTEPAQVIERLRGVLHQFVADAPQSDDLTLLALQYRSAAPGPDERRTDVLSLKIESNVSELEKVKRCLAEFLEAHALASEPSEDAQLIVEEVLVNIMQYAYTDKGSHAIEMQVAFTPEHLKMTFEDHGKPFNPLTEIAAADVATDDAQRASGGFGFHLVRALSEHMEYRRQDGKNILVVFQSLVKRSYA